MIAANTDAQSKISPQNALDMLKEGNTRFLSNQQTEKSLLEEVEGTNAGQYPFACILGCIDSRVPAELVFDTGIGDLFNARVAGNFVNTDILGSMEFACKLAGAKVILVLGHTQCGAVKGACDDAKLGNLTDMLANITPVVADTPYEGDRSSKNLTFVDMVAENNVKATIEKIKSDSAVLQEMESNGDIIIAGAMYDVTTGKVSFMD